MSNGYAHAMLGRTGRRPGAGGSREEIASAARRLFADRGCDAVTIRAIATEAGVDPALVHHFYGTKQRLFDTIMELPIDTDEVMRTVLGPGVDGLGERLARFVLTRLRTAETGDAVVGVLRTAAAQPEAAAALREAYERRLFAPLTRELDVDQPLLRAALCSSQLLGIALAEHVLGFAPLVGASTDELVAIYGPVLQRYLTGPLP